MKVVIAPRTGFTLRNPVMTASGAFGYGIEYSSPNELSSLGAIVCKGTTLEPRTGNHPERIVETAAGMLNAIGLQNVGVESVVRDKAPRWVDLPAPVLVNVSGSTIDEYETIVRRLDGVAGVAGIELNISCPNVKAGGVQFGTSPESAARVTAVARRSTGLPLVVKLSPNVSDIRDIAAGVEAAGADAVTVANTVCGMTIDARRRTPALSNVSGGLSGPAVKPYILYLLYQVAQEITIPVVGVGGIMTWADALEYVMAGATAVQLGTALLVDPTAWRGVVDGLEEWCRREGVRELSEVVGVANPGYKRKAGEIDLAG